MSEPHWLTYVGAATGIAGAAMGWIAYRRSNQVKALDMRLELRKAVNALEQTAQELNDLLPRATESRERVMVARGLHGSGAMKVWQEQFRKDLEIFRELTARKPSAEDLEKLKPEQLETRLAENHKLQLELTALVTKYRAGIAEDDQHRAEIRQSWNDLPKRGR